MRHEGCSLSLFLGLLFVAAIIFGLCTLIAGCSFFLIF